MKILIDADALPKAVKPIIYRAVNKNEIKTIVVSNKKISFEKSPFIEYIIVNEGIDKADDEIVSLCEKNDLVITADIPLADRIVKKDALALGHRGEIYDENSIQNFLSIRNLMAEIRQSGEITKGPKPFCKKDIQNFANSFSKLLYKLI
ncbi:MULTISPECIES: YaiI/YqxD family protein [unclassified Lebetimonas]|uniref:YaiI/YqxD family protein n=1 Tax=unclassified Lebetimonas TaxID=2648158 RepID=UPI0004646ECF|nr:MULTISPECIES: YaiI/YqxD family protein [unclassified Lebetimonas]